ncbi:MAG: hypothetical protein NTW87_07900 [Planctomycetota bacterium]|nr:hypothetical protein [Planctomycetota bacterium]
MPRIPVLINGHIVRLPSEITVGEAQALSGLTADRFNEELARMMAGHARQKGTPTVAAPSAPPPTGEGVQP